MKDVSADGNSLWRSVLQDFDLDFKDMFNVVYHYVSVIFPQ